jgi:tetratricopeptide (TPR) repeat protein
MPLKWNKEEIELLKKLLQKLVDDSEFSQARVVAKQLTELIPADPELWYFFGHIMTKLGEPKVAEEYLARSLELGGDKSLISAQMSFSCMLRGNLEEAIIWCRRALDLNPADAFLHQELANLYTRYGQPGKAVDVLEVLLKMPSLNKAELCATREGLGRLHLTMQQLDDALENFQKALELDDSNPAIWTNIGHCLSRKGNVKKALTAFQLAVDLLPDPLHLYNLGDAYISVDNPQKAIPPLIEAVRRNPDHALAHYDLSLAYFMMGRYTEGAEEARAALRTDPEMERVQINLGISATSNLGICLMNLGKYEDALGWFERNRKLLSSTYFNIGLTLYKMKRDKEALKNIQRALDIKPNNPEYLNLLGKLYTNLGNFKAAEKALRRSLELNPEYADSYYDLGNLMLKLKDRRQEALRCLERAIELNPDMEWTYYCLACYYALENKKTKALELLKKSLEKGLRDKDWIDSDHDLDSLRDDPRFKKLLAQYFKEQTS